MSARLRPSALTAALAAIGLAASAAPAQAAPATTSGTVLCDQLGEVQLRINGPLDRPGSVTVAGDPLVRVVGSPAASLRSASGRHLASGAVGSGISCSPLPVSGAAHQLASRQALHAAGVRQDEAVTGSVTVTVGFDDAAVMQRASQQLAATATVRAAAASSNPAGYGSVTAFPYQSQLAGYARGRSGSVALAWRGQGSSTIYSFTKGSATNVTASIVKVQVMATVMYQAQQKGRGLTAWEKSRIVPMIRNSDNGATSELWNHVGRGPAVKKVLNRMGLRSTTPGPGGYWGLTVTSAPDNVVLVDHFSRANPVLNAANRAYGLSEMRKVSAAQDWGVTAGPGDDIAVKNGWLPRFDGWHVNSIGHNHKLPRRYTAAVLTHSTTASMSSQVSTIEGLSRIIWSHQTALRGDWTNDGKVDVLGVKGDAMYLFRASSAGRLSAPRQIGTGWSRYTWIGTAGDVTGDGITDLVARDTAGNLDLFRGTGSGSLVRVRRMGTGWNQFTAIVPVGDFDGNRVPDLLARTRGGTLHRYTLPRTGHPVRVGAVGHGWNSNTRIIGVAGINNDLRGDVLAARADGRTYAYTSNGRTLNSGVLRSTGWRAGLVAGPGDLTGDTVEDAVQHSVSGITTRPVLRGGGFGTTRIDAAPTSGFRLLA